jgi:protein phosphatase
MDTLVLEREQLLTLDAAACSDRGQARPLNEDAVFQRTGRLNTGASVGLYLVCDGVGGRPAGEVASRLAIETLTSALAWVFGASGTLAHNDATLLSGPAMQQHIRTLVTQANATLRRYAQSHAWEAHDLSTTMTLALVYGDRAFIANAGDSRAYVWRSGRAFQLTRDHSLAAELVKEGKLDRSEMAEHPSSNVLLRGLGLYDRVEADLFEWELQAGDKLLLCSDGLWRAFPDASELARWLGSATAAQVVCQQLIEAANQRDGSDNISAVLVSVDQSM